jgi:predicted carbohydrate-binding protein with CBM5 and CBM33 domain
MKIRRIVKYALVAVLAGAAGTLVAPSVAEAHGAMMAPGSRTYLCWRDGKTSTGQIIPQNPACAAAVAQSGATSLYNWFAVLRSDGAGRMSGFIQDGQLCSGGTGGPYDFTGFNLPRNDWPVTHLTAGASMRFDYNNWAKHPGTFSLYITKDSWSPTRALAWNDLEPTPFSQVVNPASVGGPGTDDGRYSWTANLPSGKSGRHLIYSVWSRSDSAETFYGCSDVVFDGGTGQVTGVGSGTVPPPDPDDPDDPDPDDPAGSCVAAYRTTSSWNGGFQGEVTVGAPTTPVNNWMVHFTFPGSQTITQSWNGKHSTTGSMVMLSPEAWTSSIPPGGSVQVGFLGSGAAPSAVDNLMCMT